MGQKPSCDGFISPSLISEGKQVFVSQTCRRRDVRTKTQLDDYKTP